MQQPVPRSTGSIITFRCFNCREFNEVKKPLIDVSFLNDAREGLREVLEASTLEEAKKSALKALPKA